MFQEESPPLSIASPHQRATAFADHISVARHFANGHFFGDSDISLIPSQHNFILESHTNKRAHSLRHKHRMSLQMRIGRQPTDCRPPLQCAIFMVAPLRRDLTYLAALQLERREDTAVNIRTQERFMADRIW